MNPRPVPPDRPARSVLATQSDERLTALVATGSEAAFEALVARHRRSLVRHCAGILGPADAEEAVQDALLRAHAALCRGTTVHHAGSWLHAIAHNTALNALRSRAARVQCRPALEADEQAAEDGTAAQRVRLQELVTVVGALPSRQRDAIVMRELEGRSYTEIGQRLGASPSAVRQLINRARTTVRRRLAALLPWDPLIRWAMTLGGGARAGALSDACVTTIKVCAALVPAASVGIGGLTVLDHGAGGPARPALRPRGDVGRAAVASAAVASAAVGSAAVGSATVAQVALAQVALAPPADVGGRWAGSSGAGRAMRTAPSLPAAASSAVGRRLPAMSAAGRTRTPAGRTRTPAGRTRTPAGRTGTQTQTGTRTQATFVSLPRSRANPTTPAPAPAATRAPGAPGAQPATASQPRSVDAANGLPAASAVPPATGPPTVDQ